MKMEQTQCSETSAIKHLTPQNNPKDTHDVVFIVLSFRVPKFCFDTRNDRELTILPQLVVVVQKGLRESYMICVCE
jgi:hypothetical protein